MTRTITRPGLALALALVAPAVPAASTPGAGTAGTVKAASGPVTIERGGVRQPLRVGDRVAVGERIRTGAGGRAAITLDDDTRISAGERTALEVKSFAFDPTSHEGNLAVAVLRGVTAFVSGVLAKSGHDRMRVTIPNATVGVRGTEFVVEVEPGARDEE